AIDPQIPSTVYAACAAIGNFEVNKNQFDGVPGPGDQNWIGLENQAMDTDNQNFIPPLVLDPTNPQNLYFGTYRVWQSTNGGISWNVISPDLTGFTSNQNCSGGGCVITSVAVAPSSSNTVYVGTDVGAIWVSNNLNSVAPTFTEIDNASTPGRVVTQVIASPAAPNTAFAAFSGFSGFNGDNLGHIFETTNGGTSWTDISGNLPNTPVNDVVVDPDDVTNNTLYVATDVGVFATSNGGTSWLLLQSGLPHVECTSLKLNETARILQVGTHGRGVWDLQLPFAAGITSALTGISPASASAGSGGVTMTLTGFGFPASPTVNFGSGVQLTPTTASATQITVNVPASALASAGEVAVSVTGANNSLNFSIEGPVPSISGVNPGSVTAGANATLTITGANFVSNSEVVWTPSSGPNQGVSTTISQNNGSVSCTNAVPPCTFTVTVPAGLLTATLGNITPIDAPTRGPREPALPWFLAAACAALLGIALFLALPRKRRAVLGATAAMILLLSFIGGCSNNGNPPPIKLGNAVSVVINVNNPGPGGGISLNTGSVTVNPQ
ncbi:MAG TPA: IPT/TIG domain-containing protein, partial [Candidatus Acidoferrum sp.]|nr:IPT/TIG domain-containing protein [Candidatus Acidoferrum sp.]